MTPAVLHPISANLLHVVVPPFHVGIVAVRPLEHLDRTGLPVDCYPLIVDGEVAGAFGRQRAAYQVPRLLLSPLHPAINIEEVIVVVPTPVDVPPALQPIRHRSQLRCCAIVDFNVYPPFQLSPVVIGLAEGALENVAADPLATLSGIGMFPLLADEVQRDADVKGLVAANVSIVRP